MIAKKDPKLRNRIRNAKFRREIGDETLKDIAIEIGLPFAGVYNHAKKHITDRGIAPETKEIRIVKKSEEIKASVARKHELAIDHDSIIVEDESVEALKEYIRQGYAMVKEGKINITAQSFLQAVRIDIDRVAKTKDRQVDIIKTMYRFASGASTETNKGTYGTNPSTDQVPGGSESQSQGNQIAAIASGSVDSGTEGPSDIHNEDARDAITRWAAGVSGQNPEVENAHQLADVLEPLG